MRRSNKLICFILLLSLCFWARAQVPMMRFRHHQVDNGLSENTVFSIVQDSRGYMWFGTKDGLNRFDGISYKTYRNDNTRFNPGNNFVRSITNDNQNRLWLGTDVGVWIMDTQSETFSRFDKKSQTGEQITRQCHSICIDSKSRVWIGSNTGLYLYEPQEDRLNRFSAEDERFNLPSNIVWRIYEDRAGTIWVGTREGLVRYDEQSQRMTAHKDKKAGNVGEDEIMAIHQDPSGTLWLGTWSGGLKRFDADKGQYRSDFGQYSSSVISHIRTLFDYSDTQLLIGSDDGLYLFDKSTWKTSRIDRTGVSHSLSDKNVYDIYRDREGGIWIGTYFGGVNYLLPDLIELYTPDYRAGSLSGKAVSRFCEDSNGNLWIATEDGGVNYFNVAQRTFENHRVPPISYHNVQTLLLDDDNLWIGTFSRGIDIYNTRTRAIGNMRHNSRDTTTLNDNCIFSMYKTSSGDIYVGTPAGLNRYNRRNNSFERLVSCDNYIIDICQDNKGNLWLASCGSGLMRYRPESGKLTTYVNNPDDTTSLPHNKVTALHIDSKGGLWVATEGGGICLYDYTTDSFTSYDKRHGLANNVVYGVLSDHKGDLWLSTNKGINRFNPKDSSQNRHYTKEDGLQSNEFNYRSSLRTSEGKFFFGGINGFNAFFPTELVVNPHKPSVAITSIDFLNSKDAEFGNTIQSKINRGESLTLPHSLASFTISYVALSYASPKKNNYAYMLDGADKSWNYSQGGGSVTYVNLAAGHYTFCVRASNNNGVWNNEGTKVHITIRPPWWRSSIAKIIYLTLFVWALYAVTRFYIVRNKKRSRNKLDEYKKRQQMKNLSSKINFFTSIAHEIKTPLSLIKAPLEAIISSGEGSAQVKENLSTIERSSLRLMELINQLLDFRKLDTANYKLRLQSVTIVAMIEQLTDSFRDAAQRKGVRLSLENNIAQDTVVVTDPDALTKIVTNILSNALKFTSSSIAVTLRGDRDECTLTVADDGNGIDDLIKGRIFEPFFQAEASLREGTGIGLSLAKLLADKLQGSLTVSDNNPKGALFTFSFGSLNAFATSPTAQEPTEAIETTNREQANNTQQPTILFVDDNAEIRQFIKSNFREFYNILTAEDASEALEVIDNNSIDLLIVDIMMPGIDGITLAKSLKNNSEFCHIPIILLSAKSTVDTKVEGLEIGVDVFIEKPFSPAHLKAQIDSLLHNRNRLFEAFSNTPVAMYGSLVRDSKDKEMLLKMNEEIEKHISDPQYNVETLSYELGMSRSNLQRKLKGVCGMTPHDYLCTYRLKRAAELLTAGDYRINEVCFLVGFNSPSYFAKCFHKQFGVLPKNYNKE